MSSRIFFVILSKNGKLIVKDTNTAQSAIDWHIKYWKIKYVYDKNDCIQIFYYMLNFSSRPI